MNINNLNSQLKFPNRIGATLSVQEKTGLELAVLKLSEERHFDRINFWGRVDGIVRNYYIVQGINQRGKYNFPEKIYFWSSQNFKFAELPQPRKQFQNQAQALRDFFTGQHEKVLIQNKTDQKKVIKNGDQNLIIPPKHFTQLDRLSIVVHSIEQQCQIIPLGSYKLAPTHELIRNIGFKGLRIEESSKLQNYVHYRKPKIHQNILLIESDEALQRLDFLDSIKNDSIIGSWSIQADESKTQVTVRSLLWPGYLGYHRTNSNIFGGVYFGQGIKNIDLPFII